MHKILKDLEARMHKSIDAFKNETRKLRTGRAHAGILDHIRIDYYGSILPINQVANINVVDARTLTITPWEKNMIAVIEKAIINSDLGLNPTTVGNLIRLPMPALNEERRKELIKVLRSEAETARVSIRTMRREANTTLKEMVKSKEMTEDEEHRLMDDIQELTDKFIAEVEQLLVAKEADLMAV